MKLKIEINVDTMKCEGILQSLLDKDFKDMLKVIYLKESSISCTLKTNMYNELAEVFKEYVYCHQKSHKGSSELYKYISNYLELLNKDGAEPINITVEE